MGEIKSVKVDNWGVFFLQKLQNFFNKTDYCDLTLQFNDNSQLKVHRLVLSACTDYFNVLEQTCEMIDDALLMPNELQADVVVPIVNFMYTGTLEFELKMYGKLLRTAKEMNMTVLLKLLEAHRRTMEGVNRAQQRPSSPKNVRKRGPAAQTQMRPIPTSPQQQQQQQRRILTSANVSPQRRLVQTKPMATNANQQPQVQQYRQQIGSTSLLKTSVTGTSPLKMQRSTYESTNYASGGSATTYESTMQFKEEQHDDYDMQLGTINQSTSPFEQLRKGYNNNKRPASATFISPPAKKPNIEDVKEFAEQQRMRKQIAAEYGEDQEYEGPMLDDDIHNDDDDEDAAAAAAASSSIASASTTAVNARQHQQGPSIIIKQEPNEKPTIVVKDSANSKMNHAKIISEVLRQYPHLVKSNKNIKLKIMPNIGGQSQKIIVKKEQIDNISAEMKSSATNSGEQCQSISKSVVSQPKPVSKPVEKSSPPPPSLPPIRPTQKLAAVASNAAATITTTTPSVAPNVPSQKRRIDSKTMHALIAQGAENTTGPWLCLRCGVNGRPISIPSYRGFRRHLINTHKETIDPALCEHCGWRSSSNRDLHFHTQVEHKIKTSVYSFPECLMCTEIFIDTEALNEHMVESHPNENQQQCIYCNKIFAKEIQLYTHMKTYHKKQAIDDGIIDYSDDDDDDEAMQTQEDEALHDSIEEKPQPPPISNKDKKIKILSDISLPSTGSLMKLEPSSEAAALTTIASGIAASIGLETSEEFISTRSEAAITTAPTNEPTGEPKFVTADGNEMVLTDEQRKEIMSQLNQEHDGGVVMVLNETSFSDPSAAAATAAVAVAETNEDTSQDIASDQNEEPARGENETADDAEASADEDEFDDNIIYSEFVNKTGTEVKKDMSGLEESKGSIDNLEWAENLVTAHEMEEEIITKKNTNQTEANSTKVEDSAKDRKKNEDISKKLKELTGDWSDDEIDEDEEIDKDSTTHVKEIAKDPKSKDTEILESSKQNVEEEQASKILEKDEDQAAEEDKSADMEMTDLSEERENEEPEDDIDIALKSLHQEDVETTNANVTDELHDTFDSVNESCVVKKENASSTDKNKKNELKEEPEIMSIDLPTESDATAIEEKAKGSNVEDTSTCSDNKNTKDLEDEPTYSDDHAACKEIKEDTIKYEDKNKDVKSDEEDIQAAESALKTKDNGDDDDANVANDNIGEPQDTDIDAKSPAVETPKTPEAKTLASVDSLPVTAVPTEAAEDKVKTLISEWGDDDDDEVEDLGTLM